MQLLPFTFPNRYHVIICACACAVYICICVCVCLDIISDILHTHKNMYACVCVCIYIYIYIYACICTHAWSSAHMYGFASWTTHVSHKCKQVHTHKSLFMSVHSTTYIHRYIYLTGSRATSQERNCKVYRVQQSTVCHIKRNMQLLAICIFI